MTIPVCGVLFQIFYEEEIPKIKVYKVQGIERKYAFFHRFFYDYSELVQKIYEGDENAKEELQKIIAISLSTELKHTNPPHEFYVLKENNILCLYYYIWNNDREDISVINEPSNVSLHLALYYIVADGNQDHFVSKSDFSVLRYLHTEVL